MQRSGVRWAAVPTNDDPPQVGLHEPTATRVAMMRHSKTRRLSLGSAERWPTVDTRGGG